MDAVANLAVAKKTRHDAKSDIKRKTKLRAKLKKDIQKWMGDWEKENGRKPDEGEVSCDSRDAGRCP